MATINNGKGFENFDYEAHKIEQSIIKKEREEEAAKPKRGRPPKPRATRCIYCGNKFAPRAVDINLSEYESAQEVIADNDNDDLLKITCDGCKSFWGLHREGYEAGPDHYPGWAPEDAIDRLLKAKEAGYAIILKTQSFGTPSGNTIQVEFGDVFPIKRVGASDDNSDVRAIDAYSIDILVGVENLRLFPWEFGTMSWTELMMELRDKQYEAVYLGTDDVAGYYEPVPEVREMIKNAFGER